VEARPLECQDSSILRAMIALDAARLF